MLRTQHTTLASRTSWRKFVLSLLLILGVVITTACGSAAEAPADDAAAPTAADAAAPTDAPADDTDAAAESPTAAAADDAAAEEPAADTEADAAADTDAAAAVDTDTTEAVWESQGISVMYPAAWGEPTVNDEMRLRIDGSLIGGELLELNLLDAANWQQMPGTLDEKFPFMMSLRLGPEAMEERQTVDTNVGEMMYGMEEKDDGDKVVVGVFEVDDGEAAVEVLMSMSEAESLAAAEAQFLAIAESLTAQ